MKIYARIQDGKVVEIIRPMTDAEGQEIPIEDRFHPDIVATLINISDVPDVLPGDKFADGQFTRQAPIEPVSEPVIDPVDKLKAFLSANPDVVALIE